MLEYKTNKGRDRRKSQQDEIEKREQKIRTLEMEGKVTIHLLSLPSFTVFCACLSFSSNLTLKGQTNAINRVKQYQANKPQGSSHK
jgi:hypothetical protein